ncbi:DUF6119 family protein [Inquilinus sp.]|uniref:DUF6119 family protein n=1 Tax=Inquilinus sp. TaxID=1932117 RepID=UPI0031D066D2
MDIKRIVLYKIKSGLSFEDYLKGSLSEYDSVVDAEGGYEVYIKYVNARGSEKTEEQVPWLRFLNSGFGSKRYTFNAANHFPRAIMAIKFDITSGSPSHYVLAFGQHGDVFLDRNKIIHDFGIKVGMNICDTERLRRVQTTFHESISRQTERQASIGANLRIFGINSEAEFLRTISGYVKAEYHGIVESFKGRDNISIKLPRDRILSWSNLVDICRRLNERYHSLDYRETEFKIYDVLRHETDPEIIENLDQALCAKIAVKDFGKIHLSPPEFVESEYFDFCYIPVREGVVPPLYEDLRIEDLVNIPRRRLKGLTSATLKSWNIYTYDSEQNSAFVKWNAYQCIVAEIELSGKIYVLANGQWREISPELQRKVSGYFTDRNVIGDPTFLPSDINIYDSKRNQHREEIYNRAVALADSGIFLFDKGKVKIAGQGLYEICDLFQKDKKFVHVKRYTSGAGSISHIFTQTKLYSHAFSTDAETRKSFVDWIDASSEPENDKKDRVLFKSLVPENSSDVNESEYTVIFCILHTKQTFSIMDLPFMSQYELMLTHRYLTEDRRYKVEVVFRKININDSV